MMENFMVEISLPKVMDDEFLKLIPLQRTFINKMMKRGIIVNYSLSLDRGKLWVVFAANSVFEVKKMIGSFPIFGYIHFNIHELLFHESSSNAVPHVWLN
jgi:hypothetical protein